MSRLGKMSMSLWQILGHCRILDQIPSETYESSGYEMKSSKMGLLLNRLVSYLFMHVQCR